MRLPAPVLTAGLSAAAALLLTACGGSDEDAATTAEPTAGSSAAASGSTSEEDVQAFCTEAEEVFTRVGTAFNSVTDPANFTTVLDQGVTAFDEVEPPAEISSDWTALQEGLAGLRDAIAGIDVETPEGQTALQGAVTDFQTDTAEPQQNLEQFVTANCDNAATDAPTSAPTS
jgi:hypothetical protein